jgi:antitoxin component YwqK of YwqJK toxin-antitoxin module
MGQSRQHKRIDIDDIDFDDYIYYYEGIPYTGVAYELDDNGRLRSELTFFCGLPDGRWCDYYENGNLSGEDFYRLGLSHGQNKEWHPNGVLKKENCFEYGICTRERKWDADGNLITDSKIDPGCDEYEQLAKRRLTAEEDTKSVLAKLGCNKSEYESLKKKV